MFIDLPKEKFLPQIEAAVKEELKKADLPHNIKINIDRLEWLDTGIRVWIRN